MITYIPLSAVRADSRTAESVVSFSASASHSWSDFIRDVSTMRAYIQKADYARWIINSDDIYCFICAFVAVLQSRKEALLCANTTPAFIAEILDDSTGFLCGQVLPDAVRIQDILAAGVPDADLAFPPIVAAESRVTLYTSGSTGSPKAFPKRLTELEVETSELCRIWGDLIEGRRIYSTVNHQHIYGLLFVVLLPLGAGIPVCADMVRYPESLESLGGKRPMLVCSPAFFKRVAETNISPDVFSGGPLIFSSGGVLAEDIAREVERRLGESPLEIYGSTETGGIAFRKSVREKSWTPFPRHTISINEEGRIVVKSPYILDPAGFVSGDLGHFTDANHFLLDGRADSIVKIEEKRISLTEVERRITESPMAKEACVIALTGKRQYLGAVIVLSPEGKDYFRGKTKLELNNFFHDHLSRFLENTVIPKKWRFVDAIPRNSQDKLLHDEIEALFRKTNEVEIRSVQKDESSLQIELSVGEDSVFFSGHFPSFKILPGVVQFDLVMKYSAEYLGLGRTIKAIPRVKFRKPIRPETVLLLEIKYNQVKNCVSFSYKDANTKVIYSDGSIVLESL
jgi:acyl-CoA synthetase (AMP-forming)/AMP-acid ligase II